MTRATVASTLRGNFRPSLILVTTLFLGAYVLSLFESKASSPLFLLSVVLLFVIPSCLWNYFKGGNYLRCYADTLEVIHITRGREVIQSYSKNLVKRVRFGEVSVSQYGAINGLLFEADGKKFKTVSGLESPEAQTVLRQFDRLGYEVVHDIGMPMMVEMALERRKRGF